MSVNYTTVVVAKPKRSQKEPARHNDAGSSVTYTTITHVVPTSHKAAAPEAEVSADAETPQKNEAADDHDPSVTYRVIRDFPKEVDLAEGEEIVSTKYKEGDYFMKGRVRRTGEACHLPAHQVERSSHSKYVFVVKSDYKRAILDIKQGDTFNPIHGWIIGTVTRTGEAGLLPYNYVLREPSQKGAYRALYNYDATDDDDVSFVEGDIITTDVILGTYRRKGQAVVLPMNILERDISGHNIEVGEWGITEVDGDWPSTLLERAAIVHPSVISKKLVIVGDHACGKTWLLYAINGRSFPEVDTASVLDKYSTSIVAYGKQVDFTLMDTAGQEEYDKLRTLTYPNTDVYLVCYDICNQESLLNIKKKWVPEVRHHTPNVPIILVGNKGDLRDKEDISSKLVNKEDVSVMAKKIGAVEYLECSSKTKVGVLAVFEAAARAALLADKQNKNKCALQ